MNFVVAPLAERRAWSALFAHQKAIGPLHLRNLFVDDPASLADRVGRCFVMLCEMTISDIKVAGTMRTVASDLLRRCRRIGA